MSEKSRLSWMALAFKMWRMRFFRTALRLTAITALTSCLGAGDPPNVVVTGRVTYTATLFGNVFTDPVKNARVSAQGNTTTTDADGRFTLSGLTTGITDLTISADGFADRTMSVELRDDIPRDIVVAMTPVPQVVLGDTAIRMSGPGIARTSLGYKLTVPGQLVAPPTPSIATTGPFTAVWENDNRYWAVKITAMGPGIGTVVVSFGNSSQAISVEAVSLKFKTINVGAANACAIALDDTTWCWGGNYGGQLGASTPSLCYGGACQYGGRYGNETPLPVPGDNKFVQVATMGYACAYFGPTQTCGTSCGLVADGRAWCWGGTPKQMTVSLKRLAFRALGGNGSTGPAVSGSLCGLNATGMAICFTTGGSSGGDGLGGMTFKAYSVGQYHSCGVDDAGDVYCWGGNTRGELGIGGFDSQAHSAPIKATTAEKFVDVSLGDSSTCALATTGVIYCWGLGYSSSGESPPPPCGGTALCQLTPRAVSSGIYAAMSRGRSSNLCGLTAAGAIDCWAAFNTAPVSPAVPPLKMISVGSAGTGFDGTGLTHDACGLTADGIAYCWKGTTVFKIAQP